MEEFIESALTDESCMLNYKPIGETRDIVENKSEKVKQAA